VREREKTEKKNKEWKLDGKKGKAIKLEKRGGLDKKREEEKKEKIGKRRTMKWKRNGKKERQVSRR
jgi:hypothetical protein